MRVLTLIVLLGLAMVLPAQTGTGEETGMSALEAVFANPAETGMVVTSVVEGTQAAKLGVRVGDIMISYGGVATPNLQALIEAKKKVGETGGIETVFVRGKERIALSFTPGQMGLHLQAVTKGVPLVLPPATGVKFDFATLVGKPQDTWFAFTLDGKTKVGFEHDQVRIQNGKIILRREVAFDGGEQWGRNHFDVTVVATAEAMPQTLRTRFVTPLMGWVAEGEIRRAEDGTAEWHFRAEGKEGVKTARFPMPKDLIASYMVETLAAFMPRMAGACWHYRIIDEGQGRPDLMCALVSIGTVEIEHEGAKVEVWRVQQVRLGGQVSGTYDIGPDGRMIHVDYGGAQASRSTKEAALKDLHPELKPRTAD